MIAIGITRGGPDPTHCTRATARGPLLRCVFRCAAAVTTTTAAHISATATQMCDTDLRPVFLRCNMSCCRRGFIMQANDKAPDFTLRDQDGGKVSLRDFRGRTVVLYFFPKANTPG